MQGSVLITGANRGLGLEFARQYAAAGWRVFACCREPEQVALAGERVTLHALDVADPGRIEELAQELRDEPIDLLLCNAGIYARRGAFGDVDYAAWAESFAVNTMAPLRLTECFVEHVAQSAQRKIAIVTSRMGSIADNTSGGSYPYRSSKAAVNMVARSLSIDLRPRGIAVVVLHPGWVRTRMGGSDAPLSVEESVSGMRAVLERLAPEQSGTFKLHDGSDLPW